MLVVVKMRKELKDRLKILKKAMKFKTIQELVGYLILMAEEKKVLAVANYVNIFKATENRPCIITGPSGCGKTTAVKKLIQEADGDKYCLFIIDVSNEYTDIKKIGLGDFFSLDFEKNKQVRFVPNGNVEISKAEAAAIFSHLNFLKTSGQLRNLVLIIEEAHRFNADVNLRSLLIEARKFIRKLILVTTDWSVYEGIAPVFRPQPWQQEPQEEKAER